MVSIGFPSSNGKTIWLSGDIIDRVSGPPPAQLFSSREFAQPLVAPAVFGPLGLTWGYIVYLGSMCTGVLISWDPATPPSPPPTFGLIYCTRALLVSQDRRHLFVTPLETYCQTSAKRRGCIIVPLGTLVFNISRTICKTGFKGSWKREGGKC
jgi:hypothetical protein